MAPTIGFVFPGQGSQSSGMLLDMVQVYPSLLDTFNEASDVLQYDLWQLCQQGPAERLNQTEFTQPLVLTADIALWRLWHEQGGPRPSIVAGHSLGEYAALVAAEALEFTDAVHLTSARGKFMQQAATAGSGAMAAIIGLDYEGVVKLCDQERKNRVLDVANINSPGQIVVAGHADAVERAVAAAREFGAKLAKLIAVGVPAHCQLMQPAVALLTAQLQSVEIATPEMAVIHNVDLQSHQQPEAIQKVLLDQLTHPVRWVETIQQFVEQGVAAMVECGPGKVLQGLNKRITPEVVTYGTCNPEFWDKAMETLQERVK